MNYSLSAGVGAFTLTGIQPLMSYRSRKIGAQPGTFVLTGQDVTFKAQYKLYAQVGVFELKAQYAGFQFKGRECCDEEELAAILAVLEAIGASVDGLEGLITTLNGLVATSANQATMITILTAISGYVDGIESLLTTLNAKDFATETTLALIKAKTDNLDVALSTRASEATLALIKSKTDNLDVALSTRASEATLATRASEATLASILAELRDDTFTTSFLWEDGSVSPHVFYREDRIKNQDDGTVTTVYTRLSDNVVVVSLPAGTHPVAGNESRKVEFYRYIAIAGGAGYSSGDWLTNTVIFDIDSSSIVSNTWYNLTTSAAIVAPSFADIKDPEYDNALEATQLAGNVLLGSVTEAAPANDTASSGLNGRLQRIAQRITSLIALLPASLGQKTMANSFPVTIASDQSPLTSSTATKSNATVTNVNAVALAANANRKACTIYNDSGVNVYISFGSAATTTSFSIKMVDGSYYELPAPVYTGAIHAITAAGSGDIRITEFT